MTQYAHSDLTSKIIGCAMRVYKKLGLGFPEKVYQNALIIELKKEGFFIEFEIGLLLRFGNKKLQFLSLFR